MSDHHTELVQWIADHLCYQHCPELIGRTCQAVNLHSLQADLQKCFVDVVPDLGDLIDPEPKLITQVLTKYKVLDLTFTLSRDLSECLSDNGIELLSDLGFLMDDLEAEQFTYIAALIGDNFEDPTLLGELQADLEEHHTVLRVLLNPTKEDGAFEVVDACITNAPSVWLHKHPYY